MWLLRGADNSHAEIRNVHGTLSHNISTASNTQSGTGIRATAVQGKEKSLPMAWSRKAAC